MSFIRQHDSLQRAQAFVYDTPSHEDDAGEDHIALDLVSECSEDQEASHVEEPAQPPALEAKSKPVSVDSGKLLASYRSLGYYMSNQSSKSDSESIDEKVEFVSTSPRFYRPNSLQSASTKNRSQSSLPKGERLLEPPSKLVLPGSNASFSELVAQFQQPSRSLVDPGDFSSDYPQMIDNAEDKQLGSERENETHISLQHCNGKQVFTVRLWTCIGHIRSHADNWRGYTAMTKLWAVLSTFEQEPSMGMGQAYEYQLNL